MFWVLVFGNVIRKLQNTPKQAVFDLTDFCASKTPPRFHITDQKTLHGLKANRSLSVPKEISKKSGLFVSWGACPKLCKQVKKQIFIAQHKKLYLPISLKRQHKSSFIFEICLKFLIQVGAIRFSLRSQLHGVNWFEKCPKSTKSLGFHSYISCLCNQDFFCGKKSW